MLTLLKSLLHPVVLVKSLALHWLLDRMDPTHAVERDWVREDDPSML